MVSTFGTRRVLRAHRYLRCQVDQQEHTKLGRPGKFSSRALPETGTIAARNSRPQELHLRTWTQVRLLMAAHDGASRLTRAVDRLCPGREFADATLFLAMASMAAALDIGKARDGEGNDITPNVSFASSSIVRSVSSRREYSEATHGCLCSIVILKSSPAA